MGIAALRKILPPAPFDVAELRGRDVAVDADNLIWSFVTALAGTGDLPKGPDGQSNAHLLGLVARLTLYAKWGARSAWIFDGVQPDLKEATLVARAERAEAARARLEAAPPAPPRAPPLAEGAIRASQPRSAAAKDLQASVWVGEEELAECRDLLDALGIPWIVAPGESDAQCAHLAAEGRAWAAVTQDWDIALFGAPRALRNLTQSATRTPEVLDLAAALAKAGLTRDQLVDAAILIGTDYNEGVAGVGPVKAVTLVKRHGTLKGALAALGAAMPDADAVRAVFLDHPVDAAWTPRWTGPDTAAARALLEGRGVGGRRVDDLLAALG